MTAILSRYEDEVIPPSDELSTDYRLQWCLTGTLEGEQFLRNQPMYEHIGQVRDYMLGFKDTLRGVLGLSDMSVDELWRIRNLLVADWTDINPIWRYESNNPHDQRSVRIHSMIATQNYTSSGSDGQVALMAGTALECGTGVLGVEWDRQTRDLRLVSLNPDDVVPIRNYDPNSYQASMAVCYRRETTVNHAKEIFPQHAEYIKMDRDASLAGWGMKHRDSLRSRISSVSAFDIVDTQNALPTQKLGAMPVVDIFYMYIDDPSVNKSKVNTIMMGDWGKDRFGKPMAKNFWSYTVEPGEPKYPLKRLIIFTRKLVLYDGPNIYWHGMFPFVKFTPYPYQGLWYGISPLWKILPLQREINKIHRALSDHIQKILRPPVYGDKNSISDPELRKIDPRMAGQRWRQNPHGKGVQIAEIPAMDPMVQWYLGYLKDRAEDITGAKAITQAFSMAEAEQIPAGESIEKMMRFAGAPNRSVSRQLERAQTEVGLMQAYNIGEFYDLKRRYAMAGEDGTGPQDFDFDPNSLIPAYTNGDYAEHGGVDGDRILDPRPRMDRARDFYQYRFALYVEPGTLMESAKDKKRMMTLLLRSHQDMDLYTTLRECGYKDIGPAPQSNIYERVMAEKQLVQLAEQAAGAGAGAGGGGGSSSGAGPSSKQGRPNSFQKPPHMEGANSGTPKNSTS